MVLNRFKILVFVQVLLIALVGLLIVLSFRAQFMKMTSIGLIILWLGQISYLSYYINQIHRDVRKFMEALRSQDTTRFFNEQNAGIYFRKLYASFNEITHNFRLIRIEKEVENQFFREVLQQSASGMMAVDQENNISLINNAALKILGLAGLNRLSALKAVHPGLAEVIQTGDISDRQVKILVDRKIVKLALKVSEIHLEGQAVRIYSLLDISREMDLNELEAWQKLIRVLNHEIINSVAPLHLLSNSLYDLFHDGEKPTPSHAIDSEIIDQTVLGLKTMIKRISGLSDFISSYKSFTETSEPDCSTIRVSEMMNHIASFLADGIEHAGIELTMEVRPQNLELVADEKLIEQSLINLVQNAVFALEGINNAQIQCKAFLQDGNVLIEVTDNGRGIPEEILDNIFTPFFSTRKNGSGIGLSLTRQVMIMHKGSIQVRTRPGGFTTFSMIF